MKYLFLSLVLTMFALTSWATDFRPASKRLVVAVPGTAIQFFSTPTVAGNLVVQADPGNVGQTIVGKSDVLMASKNGIILEPGASAAFEDLFPNTGSNFYELSEFYVDAANASDAVIVTRMETF